MWLKGGRNGRQSFYKGFLGELIYANGRKLRTLIGGRRGRRGDTGREYLHAILAADEAADIA